MDSRRQRLLEYAAIAAFAVGVAGCAWRLGSAAPAAWWPALVLVALPLGWLACDLASGVLHWAFDSLGSVHTPVIGQALIRPFREHHADPSAMTAHDFVETHGASCLAALPLLAGGALVPLDGLAGALLCAWLLAVALGALATNQCHKWAHLPAGQAPPWVSRLQDWGVLLAREHHQRHHTAPFDSHFCMACGWFNRPLDAVLRAWR